MTLVALQPSASAAAKKHFQDTIQASVPITLADRYLPEVVADTLRIAHPGGALKVWGAKPGERSQQVVKWGRLRPGDYIAFAASGRLFAGAVITSVFRSREFARALWGETVTANGSAQTWELMFSLGDIEQLDVPYSILNPLIGRSPRANVQEFAVLPAVASEALLDHINRNESNYRPEPIPGEAPLVITTAFDSTDQEVTVKRRLEQQAMKKALVRGASRAACDLCGREMSVEFLTGAHIKRRSLCTDAERVMLTAVSMLNCRYGCDELFGKGYVGVDPDGVIRVSDLLTDEIAKAYAIDHLLGRSAGAWQRRETTRVFFAFHWEHDFRRPIVNAR